jgi:hypothetical protein
MADTTTIEISTMGVHMVAMQMLITQLEACRAAVADGRETVTLLDDEVYDAVATLRETADSMVKVAGEIDAILNGVPDQGVG